MGSAISAKAADERAAEKLRIRRANRERRHTKRIMQKLSQKYDNVKIDRSGAFYYIDENNEKVLIDGNGTRYYIDEFDQPYYLDEQGEKFHYDENREPYYVEEDGTRYFLDETGNKYYFDENGKPYLVETIDRKEIDDKSNSKLNQDNGETVDLTEEELRLRSPATPDPSSSTGAEVIGEEVNGINLMLSKRKVDTLSIRTLRSADQISKESLSSDLKETPDFNDTSLESSPSMFQPSEYVTVIPKTPDYVKDTSTESETQVTAQLEAEDKILHKLLEKEKERQSLPPAKLYRKVGSFAVRTETDTKDCHIEDSVFLSNGNLVIVDSSNRTIKQFDDNLEYINGLHMKEKPFGICGEDSDDTVHVTFQSQICNGIKLFTVSTSSITETKTVVINSGTPYGIARSYKGLATVISNNGDWEIHLMDIYGKSSRILKLQNDFIKPMISPNYLTLTKDLKIIVTDKGSNSVYTFDTKGNLKWEQNDLREPMGISKDDKGSMFIATPGGVHQISESGERIKALMPRQIILFEPVSVGYDKEDGLLVIAGKSNNMIAFEMY